MQNKILILYNNVFKFKNAIFYIVLILILFRFVEINCFNWNHGNTGTNGIQYYIDSYRYIEGSEQILKNELPGEKKIEYLGYVFLLAIIKKIGLSFFAVICIQLFLALLSSSFLFDITKSITKSRLISLFAVGFYLANPFINVWHLYILTESLYTSFVIISAWFIIKSVERKKISFYILSFIIVCITASIRPNGWILFPLMIGCFLIFLNYKWYLKILFAILIALVFVMGIALIPSLNKIVCNVGSSQTSISKVFISGEVVWGHKELRLKMPEDSTLAYGNWVNGYSYIFKHPFICGKLAIYRVANELWQINRSWYSFEYKLRLFYWLIPYYLLAIIGVLFLWKNRNIKIVFSIIIAHLFIIAITYGEHEHRFLTYFLPLIYVLSSCGIFILYKYILKIIYKLQIQD